MTTQRDYYNLPSACFTKAYSYARRAMGGISLRKTRCDSGCDHVSYIGAVGVRRLTVKYHMNYVTSTIQGVELISIYRAPWRVMCSVEGALRIDGWDGWCLGFTESSGCFGGVKPGTTRHGSW